MALTNINYKTKIFGIIGNPLSHTLSPHIHNGLFNVYNYDGIYLAFEKENPEEFIKNCYKLFEVRGLSVTIPYKEVAYRLSSQQDNVSNYMQASNTLLFHDDGVFAYNTDGYGAVQAIIKGNKHFFSTNQGGDILILGSGGSAKGISYALLKEGIGNRKVLISGRNSETGVDLQNKLNSIQNGVSQFVSLTDVQNHKNDIELIINTTPVGMAGRPRTYILPSNFITKKQMVFDIVYNPIRTELAEIASKAGAVVVPGYEMLIYQAMRQFFLFTGINPDKAKVSKVRKWVEIKLEGK
ncbi:MAG: shikimate dehydrogenase [Leptospiraceae bacterium]|nr:shikimate dehydrogenase [Leptospiraceae bacterium]MCP5495793.1 shikimate dehydrogenase [Leptospiraceae bacterium]